MIAIRKENVERSTIIRSTNVAVIMTTPCLSCDSKIRVTINASDSAAAVIGRRSKASQKQLGAPQARTNAACAGGSDSDQTRMPKAAR